MPAGSDPLVLVDADESAESDAVRAVTGTLLDARQFDNLAEAFGSGSESAVDANRVGKLVLVGSGRGEDGDGSVTGGGAVVWADWPTTNRSASSNRKAGRTAGPNRTGTEPCTRRETSAAVLGDAEFALGTTEVVRDIVDVCTATPNPSVGEL